MIPLTAVKKLWNEDTAVMSKIVKQESKSKNIKIKKKRKV